MRETGAPAKATPATVAPVRRAAQATLREWVLRIDDSFRERCAAPCIAGARAASAESMRARRARWWLVPESACRRTQRRVSLRAIIGDTRGVDATFPVAEVAVHEAGAREADDGVELGESGIGRIVAADVVGER